MNWSEQKPIYTRNLTIIAHYLIKLIFLEKMFVIDVEEFAFVEIKSECSLSDFFDKPNHVYYFCVHSFIHFQAINGSNEIVKEKFLVNK